MAAHTRTEAEQSWSLQDAVDNIDGWRVLGGSRLKKLEITIHPSTFDSIRAYLQGLSICTLTVFEVHVGGKPGQVSHCYRGVHYDALSPRVKLEMLLDEDLVSDVLKAVSAHGRLVGDSIAASAVVSDASGAVCVWSGSVGSRSL